MALVIDSSLWIDFTRLRSPRALKEFILPFILDPDVHMVEPVAYEILRSASVQETKLLEEQLKTLPLLPTPSTIWLDAIKLGQACRLLNYTVGPMDLLIAATAIFYNAELVTFDSDFNHISEISNLRLKLLIRPIL